MSDIKKSKRRESKLQTIHNAYLIRMAVTKLAENNFYISETKIANIIAEKIRQYETIFSIFSQTFHDIASKKDETIQVRGKNYLLQEPEYNDVGKIKNILDKFEDRAFIEKIDATEDKAGVNIYIGKDSEFDPNVTVIKTTYKKDGEEGTIAIIGPKRMEYDRVVGLLSFINKELNEEDING